MEFDALGCCGACSFAREEDGMLWCYANPPMIAVDPEGEIIYVRQVPVEPQDISCIQFVPRAN